MVGVATTALRGHRVRAAASSIRPLLGVAGAQWLAGVGNLVFALVAARVLAPQAFAQLGAFLGAYVLLHLPAAGVGAGAALAPGGEIRTRRRLLAAGAAVGALLTVTAPWTSVAFDVPVAVVLALAAAGPSAALLGLERGILFHHERRTAIATSLVAEPVGRVGLGIVAAMVVGVSGAALAVTVSGYLALAVARHGVASRPAASAGADRRTARRATTLTFLLFAVLQQQDLLVAKARLAPDAVGAFAALSTVGGAVAFATATIPLALLPQGAHARHSGRAALGLTAAVAGGAVAFSLLWSGPTVDALFGPDYASAAPLLAPYVAAMGLLGIGRVLAAQHCATGDGRRTVHALVAGVAVHLAGLAVLGSTPSGVVTSTLAATATTTGALWLPPDAPARAVERMRAATRTWIDRRDLAVVAGLTAVATALRVPSTRGLWVDEAITVSQAQLPVGDMIAQLRLTDVHPPLHHLVVWLLVRVGGTGELVVRAPSIAAGALLVPAVFGLANALYGRRTGLIAAALTTVAPFAVWYSQEARMYALFMLFSTLALWAQVAAIRGDGRWAWIAYVAATAAMAWTQWFAIVPFVAQQAVFAGVLLRRRHDRTQRRRFLLVWAAALGATLVLVLPLVPVALDQLGAYTGRRAASSVAAAPAQAGAGASGLAGDVSVYAVGANAIWGVLGYHSDRVMTQLAALWPLSLLLGFAALGRGRSRRTTAVLVCVVGPTMAFVVAGLLKRDLFELRYFAGVVPLALVLVARTVTAVFHRHRAQLVAAGVGVVALTIGLVDQQLNGANPRRYDFEGALDRVEAEAEPGDVVLYEPDYLAEVVDYYAPDVEARSIDRRDRVDPDATTWVLATTRVADDRATSARVGDALADLEQTRTVTDEFEVPNVKVWELTP